MLFFLCLRGLLFGDQRDLVYRCLVAWIAQAENDIPHPAYKSHTQPGAGASGLLARETTSHARNNWAVHLSLKGAEGKRHPRVVGDAPGFPGSGRGHEVQLAIRDRHPDRGANSLALLLFIGHYAPFVFSSVCTNLTEVLCCSFTIGHSLIQSNYQQYVCRRLAGDFRGKACDKDQRSLL